VAHRFALYRGARFGKRALQGANPGRRSQDRRSRLRGYKWGMRPVKAFGTQTARLRPGTRSSQETGARNEGNGEKRVPRCARDDNFVCSGGEFVLCRKGRKDRALYQSREGMRQRGSFSLAATRPGKPMGYGEGVLATKKGPAEKAPFLRRIDAADVSLWPFNCYQRGPVDSHCPACR